MKTTDTSSERSPVSIVRDAARRWYEARRRDMDGYDEDGVRLHLRSIALRAGKAAHQPVDSVSRWPYRELIVEILGHHSGDLTDDEQLAVADYVESHSEQAALMVQLALG